MRGSARRALLGGAMLAAGMLPRLCPVEAAEETASPDQVQGSSQPCKDIPNCQLQQQSGVSYEHSKTRGWAYYCSGDHPYYWGAGYAGNSERWIQKNDCFTTTENGFAEANDPGKLDVLVTNWCLKTENYVITLPCSDTPPPYWGPSCKDQGKTLLHDPGCPTQGQVQRYDRNIGGVPIYFFLWEEKCSDQLYYFCSSDQLLVQCESCDAAAAAARSPAGPGAGRLP